MARKGKYDEVMGGLPKLPNNLPKNDEEGGEDGVSGTDRNARIDAIKAEIHAQYGGVITPAFIALEYDKARIEKEDIEAKLKEVNERLDAYSQLIVDIYEDEGIESIKLSSGRSISTQPEPIAQVMDKEAFRLWCLDNGLERKMSLHPSTTNALVKERLLQGMPEPEGVKLFIRTKIVRRG